MKREREKERIEPEENDVKPAVAVEETDDIRDFAGYDATLRQWLSEEDLSDRAYKATLYKYDNLNKSKQWIIGEWSNEILSAHDVGMQYGSGEYRYLLTFPPKNGKIGKIKAFKFNIHTVYDEYRKKAGITADAAPAPVPAQRGALEGIDTIRALIEALKPILPAQNAPAFDPGQMMMNQYSMMSKVLEKNLMEQISIQKRIAERYQDDQDEIDTEGGAPMDVQPQAQPQAGIWEQIKPYIDILLPQLLGNPVQAQAAAAAVKAIPQFRDFVNNAEDFARFIKEAEEKIGADKVQTVLKRLRLKRP